MKIDIIKADYPFELERELNEVIKYKTIDNIHDIKICLETNHGMHSKGCNYAIIIYK